jgi:hypothetical protein
MVVVGFGRGEVKKKKNKKGRKRKEKGGRRGQTRSRFIVPYILHRHYVYLRCVSYSLFNIQ